MAVQYTQSMQAQTSSSVGGDPIAQLPVDRDPPSDAEVQIIDTLFRQNQSTMDIIAVEMKDSLLVTMLVVLVSLPQIVAIINKFIPVTVNSPYILILIQGLITGVLFWLVKHFYLSRR